MLSDRIFQDRSGLCAYIICNNQRGTEVWGGYLDEDGRGGRTQTRISQLRRPALFSVELRHANPYVWYFANFLMVPILLSSDSIPGPFNVAPSMAWNKAVRRLS
jgi:hypothetical protein